MKTEKIIQKCIAVTLLSERRDKLIMRHKMMNEPLSIKTAAMIEGKIVHEIKKLKKLLKEVD